MVAIHPILLHHHHQSVYINVNQNILTPMHMQSIRGMYVLYRADEGPSYTLHHCKRL